ncbi:MAG: hypothetical protein HKN33_06505 [Pyrinomonadaceae bacterium]|nr:hypothetical protein [Pyrinomonadaceae bacterium]
MKIQRFARLFVLSCLLLFISIANVLAQKTVDPNAFQVVRTKSMSKKAGFGPGGTIVIVGAPHGAVSIEGWDKNRIEIEAEIQVRAHNEQDAARLANVTGFAVTEDVTSYRIFSIGPHDKKSIKKIDKKFPKKLRKNPFKIDY